MKAEKRNQKAERLSDHVERSAFSAFDFQLSAFPLSGTGKAEQRNQKAERLSDHVERSAFSAFDFQLSAFPLSGTGKAEQRNQKAERLSDHVERSAFSAFDFQLSAFPLIVACPFITAPGPNQPSPCIRPFLRSNRWAGGRGKSAQRQQGTGRREQDGRPVPCGTSCPERRQHPTPQPCPQWREPTGTYRVVRKVWVPSGSAPAQRGRRVGRALARWQRRWVPRLGCGAGKACMIVVVQWSARSPWPRCRSPRPCCLRPGVFSLPAARRRRGCPTPPLPAMA